MSNKTARVNVRIPQALHSKMEEIAKGVGCSVGEMARTCFEVCINDDLIGSRTGEKVYCQYCQYFTDHTHSYGGNCEHPKNIGSWFSPETVRQHCFLINKNSDCRWYKRRLCGFEGCRKHTQLVAVRMRGERGEGIEYMSKWCPDHKPGRAPGAGRETTVK